MRCHEGQTGMGCGGRTCAGPPTAVGAHRCGNLESSTGGSATCRIHTALLAGSNDTGGAKTVVPKPGGICLGASEDHVINQGNFDRLGSVAQEPRDMDVG